jgi:DNA-binding NarL/FixJ family response regulator
MEKEYIMSPKIRVAILDDHQGIIDGYQYRLGSAPDIDVVATLTVGEELEPVLAGTPVDILLLDINVPVSSTDPSPFPILHLLPRLLQSYPDLDVLVISMHSQGTLINAIMEAGASGYLLKDDQAAIRNLADIVRSVAAGGIYLSLHAFEQLKKRPTGGLGLPLTSRQIEVLSLCAAYPQASTGALAKSLNIANSTLRNLLSGAYMRLNVRSRTAAVDQARRLGLIAPHLPDFDLRKFNI